MIDRKEEIRIMSLPKMQERFREAMRHIIHRGSYMFPGSDRVIVHDGHRDKTPLPAHIENGVIRLPLPIDRDNPERGLWGMVDWSIFSAYACNGMLNIWTHEPSKDGRFNYDGTPALALLRALAHQWGIKVTL